MSMENQGRKPIVRVFAGPNGSGKTTVTRKLDTHGVYVNADDLKAEYALTDLEAAQRAEMLRNHLLQNRADFSFETVLSTERNLLLVEKAKAMGYEIQCIYVLTCDENINVARVKGRHMAGGHDVPEEKVRSRYHKALALIPRLLPVCDILMIYDNSVEPTLICNKEGANFHLYPTDLWTLAALQKLLSGM